MSISNLDQRSVNTIRGLSIDAVEAANSGHPGMPMGMADAAFVLWTKFLKHNPKNPNWFDRDRFILSAGHGSMLLYSLLHLTGYDLPLDEIKNFRQLGSITPGHPEAGMTPGVETTTGPLGQGFATGVGMAMAEAWMAKSFNKDSYKISDHYTYAIVSDGDLMEGISHEAASMAGHMKLGKLIYLYDSNRISIDGSTDLAFTDDSAKRFESYGWHVVTIDGHDHKAIEKAIIAAQKVTDKPSLIECKTHIGFGSPNKQDSASSHGSPLGESEVELTKKNLGLDPAKKFDITEDVLAQFRLATIRGEAAEEAWNEQLSKYKKEYSDLAATFSKHINRELPVDWNPILPSFEADAKGMATRKASGTVLNAICDEIPQLFGGSADLTGSTVTDFKGKAFFGPDDYSGRNVHYGVREHGMAAAVNGIALHGGLIPFGATFLVFSDYNRPAIRIAALTHIPGIQVFTHDSIGLGEDGPTHQPVEHLAALRAIPNVMVLRPADANETAWAWKAAIENTKGPSLMILTRQNLPVYDRKQFGAAELTQKGAYILKEAIGGKPELIVIATGSEVSIAMEGAEELELAGIATRVVSMPSWELFAKQDGAYRNEVLPNHVTARISVEAGTTFGWSRWIGDRGVAIGLDRFGESAPYEQLYEYFNITPARVVEEGKKLVKG